MDIQFENLKQEYNSRNLEIGVDLSLARKAMNDAGNITSIIWNSSFTIAMIISFIIRIILHRFLGYFIWYILFFAFKFIHSHMFYWI